MSDSYNGMLSQYVLSGNSLFRLIAETDDVDKVLHMKGTEFERCLVAVITEVAEKKGFKHKPLAESAWPDKKDPGTKWRKIRNGTEPRGLQTKDAYDLVLAMGMSFVELCGIAQGRMLEAAQPEMSGGIGKRSGQEEKTISTARPV